MTYLTESTALDTEILAVIEKWHLEGESLDERSFNDLALRLFAYQLEYNKPYARYCAQLGITSTPPSWERIPPVPAAAFKEASLTTFDPAKAALVFETSGTTRGAPGRHYMETPEIYDAALLAAFDRFMLRDGARLRYFNCVPNPVEHPQSSLGYMMARVSQSRGDARTGWYLSGDELLFDSFCSDLQAAVAQRQPVCLAATAFALVNLLDGLDEARIRIALPQGSRLMETGGFKGRARIVDRDELYARVYEVLGLGLEAIVAEYGMTELTSQYYDVTPAGHKAGPPWLRTRVVGLQGSTLSQGTIGALVHVDLANRCSCLAIETEDLGMGTAEGLLLVGRNAEAPLRGCSLDAEELRVQ
ncbi:MAG TPA: hypothetical protein VIX60_04120 [Candidatus Cybelea sp.]